MLNQETGSLVLSKTIIFPFNHIYIFFNFCYQFVLVKASEPMGLGEG